MKIKKIVPILMFFVILANFAYSVTDNSSAAINFYDKYSFYIDAIFLSFLCITFVSYGLGNVMENNQEEIRKVGYIIGLIMGISTAYGIYSGLFGTFKRLFMASPYFIFGILLFSAYLVGNSIIRSNSTEDKLKKFYAYFFSALIVFIPLFMGGYGMGATATSSGYVVNYSSNINGFKIGLFSNVMVENLVKQSNPYYFFLRFLIISFRIWQTIAIFLLLRLLMYTKIGESLYGKYASKIDKDYYPKKEYDEIKASSQKAEDKASKTEEKIEEELKDDSNQVVKKTNDVVKQMPEKIEDAIDKKDPNNLKQVVDEIKDNLSQGDKEIKGVVDNYEKNNDIDNRKLNSNNSNNSNSSDNVNEIDSQNIEKIKKNMGKNSSKIIAQNKDIEENTDKIVYLLNQLSNDNKSGQEIQDFQHHFIQEYMKDLHNQIVNNQHNSDKKNIENSYYNQKRQIELKKKLEEQYSKMMNNYSQIMQYLSKHDSRVANYYGKLKKEINNLDKTISTMIDKHTKDLLENQTLNYDKLKEKLEIAYNAIVDNLEEKFYTFEKNIINNIKEEFYEPLKKTILERFENQDETIKKIVDSIDLLNPKNQKILKELMQGVFAKRLNSIFELNQKIFDELKNEKHGLIPIKRDTGVIRNNIEHKEHGLKALKKDHEELKNQNLKLKEGQSEIIKLIKDMKNSSRKIEEIKVNLSKQILKYLESEIKFNTSKISIFEKLSELRNFIYNNKLEFNFNDFRNENLYDKSKVNFSNDNEIFNLVAKTYNDDQKIKALLINTEIGNHHGIFFSLCLRKISIVSALNIYINTYNSQLNHQNISIDLLIELVNNLKKESFLFNKLKTDITKQLEQYISSGFNFDNLKIIFLINSKDFNHFLEKQLNSAMNNKVKIESAAVDFKKINEIYQKVLGNDKNYKIKSKGNYKINVKYLKEYYSNLELKKNELLKNNSNLEKTKLFSKLNDLIRKTSGLDSAKDDIVTFLVILVYAHNNQKSYKWMYWRLNKTKLFLVDWHLDIFKLINYYYGPNYDLEDLRKKLIKIKHFYEGYNIKQHKYFWNRMSEIFNMNELKVK